MGSMAGQIAGMIIKEQTCSEIIEEMFDEFKELMNKTLKFNTSIEIIGHYGGR